MKKILILPYSISKSIKKLEYLSEGIFEELTHLISTTSDLKTTSRSTSLYLLTNPTSLKVMKEHYSIDYIIEGIVQYKDGDYQISTRLFRTSNEEILLNDLSKFNLEKWIQSLGSIANNIIVAINGRKINQKRKSEDKSKAREFYLRGLFHWHRHTHTEMLLAIKFFKKSIKENDDFALSYAALADCYSIIGLMGYEQPIPAFKLAKKFVNKALLLNDKHSDSYVSAAFVDIYYNRNLQQSKINLEQALRLNSKNVKAHHVLAMYYIHKGDFIKAEKHAAVTIKLDPLALPHFAMIIRIQLYLKKYQLAMDYINAAMNIDSHSTALKEYRGYTNLLLGNLESAIDDFKDCLQQDDTNPMSLAHLAYAYSKANFHYESKEIEYAIYDLNIKNDTGVKAYALAIVKLGQADYKAFFKYAQKAIELGIGLFPAELNSNPIFSEAREDLRFQKIMKQCYLSAEKSTFKKNRKPASVINLTSNTSEILSIDPQELAFVEASDNYCTIYWYESDILKNKTLRVTLISMETQLASFNNIVRCHKTFMINLNQKLSITGNARGYFFESKLFPVRIPVSRSKNKTVHLLFEKHQIEST